jgi:hypothetical protein
MMLSRRVKRWRSALGGAAAPAALGIVLALGCAVEDVDSKQGQLDQDQLDEQLAQGAPDDACECATPDTAPGAPETNPPGNGAPDTRPSEPDDDEPAPAPPQGNGAPDTSPSGSALSQDCSCEGNGQPGRPEPPEGSPAPPQEKPAPPAPPQEKPAPPAPPQEKPAPPAPPQEKPAPPAPPHG